MEDTEATEVLPEIRIEQDYDARMVHARAMYHMAVQAAESELETALARAEDIRAGELGQLRKGRHRASHEHKMVSPYRQQPPEYVAELAGAAITRMSDLA